MSRLGGFATSINKASSLVEKNSCKSSALVIDVFRGESMSESDSNCRRTAGELKRRCLEIGRLKIRFLYDCCAVLCSSAILPNETVR